MANIFSRKQWRVILARLLSQRNITTILAPLVDHADLSLIKLTDGRYSFTSVITGWPIVVLTTTGARSGQIRQTPLIGIPHNEKIILIGSNFGRPNHPAWYHNLKKNSSAGLRINGQSGKYTATEASGKEREFYWNIATQVYPGFNNYAKRAAGRSIPVIVLEPDQLPTET
jgi:deazaflavin-dependent oxidoreductase (nitroreductase family)